MEPTNASLADHLPVYIIHWNSPEWCRHTIGCLQTSSNVRVQVFVINNGPQSCDLLTLDLPPDAEVSCLTMDANLGYSGAANFALKHWLSGPAPAEFALLCSHDLVVESLTLASLVQAMHRHQEFGILGPVLTNEPATSGGTYTGNKPRLLPMVEPSPELSKCDWISGTCLLLRKKCAVEVGGFDDRFFAYVEDVDYCLRACDAGWSVGVVGAARASGRGTVDRSFANRAIAVNSVMLVRKRLGLWRAAAASWPVVRPILSNLRTILSARSRSVRNTAIEDLRGRCTMLLDALFA